jgi:hypothetical protein
MIQIALPLDWPAGDHERDFVVGAANRDAVRHLEHRALWPVMATILTGPRKSGRSFLGRIFAAKAGATLIDDAQDVDEELIFHQWNRAQADRRPLLIIADDAPPHWRIALPDLVSRLAATPRIAIADPDDDLAARLIEHRLGQRGIAITPDVTHWIVRQIPRTYVAILRAVDAIEAAGRGRVTTAYVRRALVQAAVIDDLPFYG